LIPSFNNLPLRTSMPFSITVQPSGHQFEVDDRETILAAALRAGVGLPYGCKNGACGSCKGQVLQGELVQGPHTVQALSPGEVALGSALFCCARPVSDLVIQCREVQGAGELPIKKLPCRVAQIERVAPDVVVIRLQLPANDRLQYLAGQYIEILLKDGKRRSYSMAGAPGAAEQLELHVRHMPGGIFTDTVFGVAEKPLKERDILRFEGPFGTFFLREESPRPIILLASGTGFAPIKAMVEHAIIKRIAQPMHLYWGGRRPHDLYMADLAASWTTRLPDFRFIPVVSDALPEDAWTGRSGFVHRAVIEDFPDLSAHQVYACGAPIVIESAQRDFTEGCGLPIEEFYSDAFTSEADLAKLVE